MTSDRYIKAVLTVIAACLVYICGALTAWPVASAQGRQEVVIVGWKGQPSAGAVREFVFPAPSGGSTLGLPVLNQ